MKLNLYINRNNVTFNKKYIKLAKKSKIEKHKKVSFACKEFLESFTSSFIVQYQVFPNPCIGFNHAINFYLCAF